MANRDFPTGFTWGAASSAHQVEGNNHNNDWWRLEHTPGSPFAEPSGDACDSFHRYSEDIALLAAADLKSYRFSIEWSRIEPEPDQFSLAALAHYQSMVDACLQQGVEPLVTLHHFTNPRWFRDAGGWQAPDAARRFQRYVGWIVARLRGVERYCTINEPNMIAIFAGLMSEDATADPGRPHPLVVSQLLDAHRGAVKLIREQGAAAGMTLAMTAFATDGSAAATDVLNAHRAADEDQFIDAALGDDFLGVQAYSRRYVTPEGVLPHGHDLQGESAEQTLTGWNYYPAAIGECVRRVHEVAPDLPMLVTENGIATADDDQRIAYMQGALESILDAIADGAPIRGYWHWTLLDNFEWMLGYAPTFGLVAVDRQTFTRTPKPSLAWLGKVATHNAV